MADMQEDLSASSAPVSGDMGDRCASHDHVGGGEGVVMCLDTQLLAMSFTFFITNFLSDR